DRSKNLGTFLREYFGKVLSILEGKKTNPPYPRWTFTLLLWSQQDVSTNLSGLRKLFRERDAVKNGNKKSALGKLNPDVLRVFQTIIEEKTKDFLGRDYIFDAIDRFLYENLCGYFLIKQSLEWVKVLFLQSMFGEMDALLISTCGQKGLIVQNSF
ncbi:MAG: hypothetical protein AAFY76_12000, partial [Cyanobacteria bacterium J06649_11]